MKNIKKSSIVWTTLILLMTAVMALTSRAASSQRVYDDAGLFTKAEKELLEQSIAELTGEMNMDFVVLTATDKEGKTQAEYADDFYDENDFGTGEDRSGLLFMIDMESRDCYISTSGDMIDYLTDARIAQILQYDDRLWELLSAGNYAGAARRVMNEVQEYYVEGPETVPEKRYNPLMAAVAAVIGALAGLGKSRSIRSEYGMKNEKRQAMQSTKAYMATTNFAFNQSADDLLNTIVTRIPLPAPAKISSGGSRGSSYSGSSTHTSSSGRTHGGGGSGGRHF